MLQFKKGSKITLIDTNIAATTRKQEITITGETGGRTTYQSRGSTIDKFMPDLKHTLIFEDWGVPVDVRVKMSCIRDGKTVFNITGDEKESIKNYIVQYNINPYVDYSRIYFVGDDTVEPLFMMELEY